MNPKISIIVPVYKVEEYIHKCIDSILKQTFEDFELILVNDGSPDRCGEICDEYARTDSRVKVIHKKNGGLSDARNVGLNHAIGDFIGFVDSDDWIEKDMFEVLFHMCVENDSDIAVCTSTIHYPNKKVITGNYSLVTLDRQNAMRALLEGKLFDEVVWTKLFRRKLLRDVRFTVGITFEDTDFTYKVIHKCKKVSCLGVPKYNYMKRKNSLMEMATRNINIDSVKIYEEMYKFINLYYNELSSLVIYKLANSAFNILNTITNSSDFNKNKTKYLQVALILNQYFFSTIKEKKYPLSVKIILCATKINPWLYKSPYNHKYKKKSCISNRNKSRGYLKKNKDI